MKFRQLYFLEGKLLAESLRGLLPLGFEPTSDLYFCGFCGDVFAKCPCLREDGSETPWQSYRTTCRRCQAKSDFPPDIVCPGSIWRSWDSPFNAALPMPVLAWELERHIECYTRYSI